MPRLHATGAAAIDGGMDAVQPVAAFCHHAPRAAQIVAFGLSPRPGLAYKLAGAPPGLRR